MHEKYRINQVIVAPSGTRLMACSGGTPSHGFIAWLFGQAHLRHIGERDDLISDIAHDVHRDVHFPKSGKLAAQRAYLSNYGEHIVEAWDAALAEFQHRNRIAKAARLAHPSSAA